MKRLFFAINLPEESKTQTVKMPDDLKELVIARLEVLSSERGFSIGGGGNLTRDELIQHVKDGDAIGQKVAEYIGKLTTTWGNVKAR